MKLPESVKGSIRKAGKYNQLATSNDNVVRKWLENNAGDLYWEDYLIDSLEQGNNWSESLIEFLKNDCNDIKCRFTE